MYTLRLDIDETIYEKFKALLELMPKDKITVHDESSRENGSIDLLKHFDDISSEDNELLKKLAL